MAVLEAVMIAGIGSLIIYLIQRHDDLDKRIDNLEKHILIIETAIAKRKTDRADNYYHSPNSGIDL